MIGQLHASIQGFALTLQTTADAHTICPGRPGRPAAHIGKLAIRMSIVRNGFAPTHIANRCCT